MCCDSVKLGGREAVGWEFAREFSRDLFGVEGRDAGEFDPCSV